MIGDSEGMQIYELENRNEAIDWGALPQKARDAILSAYLGIAVLETMCRVNKLESGRTRSRELLIEMAEAFPVLPGLSSLRTRP